MPKAPKHYYVLGCPTHSLDFEMDGNGKIEYKILLWLTPVFNYHK